MHRDCATTERNLPKLANEQFDVTIIGSGPGGYVAAIRAGQLGLKVAIVEKDKRLGGTCTLRGCIPTKQLLMSAHVYEQMQHAADFGVQASGIQLAFADVQKRKEKVVMKNSKGIEFLMKKNKCTVFKGTGKLALPGQGVVVTGKTSKGEDVRLEAEMLLVAVGRSPFTKGLGLEGTKIKVEKGFIQVDEFQQTAEKGVYAIGDVVPTPLLAHLASKEGVVAVEHLAGKNPRSINLRLVPNCTYCDPEVASVGLTEAKAKEAGYDVKVGKFPFSASGKARILGEEEGFVKIVAEKKYDEILGVHIIGPHATELIAEACVAMQLESTAEELGNTMHAHPTVSEAVMEAAEGVHDMTIHL